MNALLVYGYLLKVREQPERFAEAKGTTGAQAHQGQKPRAR
jgi:hypothetical protein